MIVLTLVLASGNAGKVAELRTLLGDLPVQVVGFSELVGPRELAEDGDTFEANAAQKARAVCALTHMVSLADDSGLEVDALDGRPGVRSARYASERATDAENNAALLAALEAVPDAERSARFRCVLALVTPWEPERVRYGEGTCSGHIVRSARGSAGFGYDPLFVADECPERTLAELTRAEKNALSHRARAVAALRPRLIELIQAQLDETERISG